MSVSEGVSFEESQAMFNRQLATYRKIVAANCMYHREVYALLRNALAMHMPAPFAFVDIACGDASASAVALKDTSVRHYYGIDLSARSLEIAKQSLSSLPCTVELQCHDFAEAMKHWSAPADFVWVGMSLHHLQQDQKFRFARDVRRAQGEAGVFMIWEPTLLEGERRDAWLDRFAACRTLFSAVTDEEFAEMDSHMRLADFPETAKVWTAIGREAGFQQAAEVFMMPNRMGRVFKFWN